MANDKKISDLPIVSTISANDNSVLVKNGTDYQFAFDTLLQFIGSELSVGANITFGSTLPPNNTGKNGDIFINTTTGSFAQKLTNTWTVVYTLPQGNNTVDGTVLYGNSNPGTSIGNNNDTFINTASGIFFKKSAGVWNQVFSMQTGPAGPRGNSVLNGSVDPTAAIGQNGDFYYNTATQYIFGPKSASAWPTGTRLKGANGNTILHGTATPSNLNDGVDGDFFINISTYNIFGPKVGGIWPTPFSLIYDLGYTPENSANKNQPNGYAGLDGTGKVAASQLPSYVDDVLEFTSYPTLPATGETGKIYVTLDTNLEYRWSGSAYIQLVASPGTTDNVPEGSTNKYFTAARAIASALTGLGVGDASAVTAADTIVIGIGKLQAQINNLPSGSSDYTLPVASPSVLGGVKQGANIHIDGGGVISVIQTDADANKQSGSLSLINTTTYSFFGDSVAAGFGASSPFKGLPRKLPAQLGYIPNVPFNLYAQSGSTINWSAGQAMKYITDGTSNALITLLAGVNDARNFGDVPILYTATTVSIRAFLAACFLSSTQAAADAAKTGTWDNTFDSTSWGGRSPYLPFGSKKGASSMVAGSTMSITLDWFEDTVVIGTFATDGQAGNILGEFDVYINNVFYIHYNPNGRNHGINSVLSTPATAQKWSPDVIIVKGCEGSTVKIVTSSNTQTVVDFLGKMAAPQNCSPIIISTLTSIDFVNHPEHVGLASQLALDNMSNAIMLAVQEFKGWPVAVINPNKYWDVITESADGLHPNDLGHTNLTRAFIEAIQGSTAYYVDPHKDLKVSGLTIGQGPQTSYGANNLGAVLGGNALGNNTSGGDNVAIGGLAGGGNTTGSQNVFIGREAGSQNVSGNDNVYIGFKTGHYSTGYGNTIIGSSAELPNPSDHDSLLITAGGATKSILLNGSLSIKGMDAPVVSAGIASTHKVQVIINDTPYYLMLSDV